MPPMAIAVKPEDIRRIRIACRCGEKSVAEVPQQLARMINVHVCPKCLATFGIQQQGDKSWKIKRVDMEGGVAISADEMERLMGKIGTKKEEDKLEVPEVEVKDSWKN